MVFFLVKFAALHFPYFATIIFLKSQIMLMTHLCPSSDSVRALVESFSHLSFGSAFWHGSHTRLGNTFDNDLIGVLSFIAYQETHNPMKKKTILSAATTDVAVTSRLDLAVGGWGNLKKSMQVASLAHRYYTAKLTDASYND